MEKLRIFVCGHDERLKMIPNRPFITHINLNHLEIGIYQNNQFSESRLFFSDLVKEPVEYIGFASASWRIKWNHILPVHQLDQLELKPNRLWCPSLEDLSANETWIMKCNYFWPELLPYIFEMAKVSGLSTDFRQAPISNNFIVHWDVWNFFISEWMKLFNWLYKEHPPEKVLKELKMKNVDESRLYGYILERISMLILSNLPNFFTNYELCLIPKPKNKKLPLRLI